MALETSLTGIPTDVLFGTIAALGGLVYRNIIKNFDELRMDGRRRARNQAHMQSYQRLICNRLRIPYNDPPTCDEE